MNEFLTRPLPICLWEWWGILLGVFVLLSIHFYFQARVHKMYAAVFAKWAKDALEDAKNLRDRL